METQPGQNISLVASLLRMPPTATKTPPHAQAPVLDMTSVQQNPLQSASGGGSLDNEIGETIKLVKQEIPTSVSGVGKLPFHLFLILLGAGLAIFLGLVFFLFQLVGWRLINAIVNLLICLLLGSFLLYSFAVAKRRRLLGGVLSGMFSLVLIIAGGPAGLIGGLVALCGAGIIFLKEFEILPK